MWYPLSKTLAEKAAWDFSKENGLDVVVVNPGTVMGPVIPPRINASMLMLVRLIEGNIIYFDKLLKKQQKKNQKNLAIIMNYFKQHLIL